MSSLFLLIGSTAFLLIAFFLCITFLHYFFYIIYYAINGKNKTINILSNNCIKLNLFTFLYILLLLPLLLSVGLGLLDSFKIIDLYELLNDIKTILNSSIEIKKVEHNIYKDIGLLLSFILVFLNLMFIANKRYTFFIRQAFLKYI